MRDDSVKTIERASVDSRGRWSEKLITDDSARPGRCCVPVGMLLAQSGDDEMRRGVGRGLSSSLPDAGMRSGRQASACGFMRTLCVEERERQREGGAEETARAIAG